MQSKQVVVTDEMREHPLYPVFMAAIRQAMYGKGERHGGALVNFLEQPWAHYANMHGRGFLTGQAAKKLEEAASTRNDDAFISEVLGAMVYLGMSVLHENMDGEQFSIDEPISHTISMVPGPITPNLAPFAGSGGLGQTPSGQQQRAQNSGVIFDCGTNLNISPGQS